MARALEISPTVAMAQRAAARKASGKDVLDFSVGEPDQPTPAHVVAAATRALEAGRYLLRAANDGESAIIGPRGELLAVAPEYRSAVLRGTVAARSGLPPYTRVGNWAVDWGIWSTDFCDSGAKLIRSDAERPAEAAQLIIVRDVYADAVCRAVLLGHRYPSVATEKRIHRNLKWLQTGVGPRRDREAF
jgi:hypothetical protein